LIKSVVGGSFEYLEHATVGLVTLTLSLYLSSHYNLHAPAKFRKVRAWGLIGVAICLTRAVQIAWQQPGAMRLLISQESEATAYLRWQGVPSYYLIYTFSMCLVLFLNYPKHLHGLTKYLFGYAICIFVIHIALSTLTLATVLLAGVAVVWGGYWLAREHQRVVPYLAIALISFVALSVLLDESMFMRLGSLEQIEKVTSKAERIFTGLLESGLREGDETGRGNKMASSIETFWNYPVFGMPFGGRVKGGGVGGHSSIVDPFGMFGLLGYIPMWTFYYILIRNSVTLPRHPNGHSQWRVPEVFAWCFYGIASFWNPTTFSVLPYALLFLTVVNPQLKANSRVKPKLENW